MLAGAKASDRCSYLNMVPESDNISSDMTFPRETDRIENFQWPIVGGKSELEASIRSKLESFIMDMGMSLIESMNRSPEILSAAFQPSLTFPGNPKDHSQSVKHLAIDETPPSNSPGSEKVPKSHPDEDPHQVARHMNKLDATAAGSQTLPCNKNADESPSPGCISHKPTSSQEASSVLNCGESAHVNTRICDQNNNGLFFNDNKSVGIEDADARNCICETKKPLLLAQRLIEQDLAAKRDSKSCSTPQLIGQLSITPCEQGSCASVQNFNFHDELKKSLFEKTTSLFESISDILNLFYIQLQEAIKTQAAQGCQATDLPNPISAVIAQSVGTPAAPAQKTLGRPAEQQNEEITSSEYKRSVAEGISKSTNRSKLKSVQCDPENLCRKRKMSTAGSSDNKEESEYIDGATVHVTSRIKVTPDLENVTGASGQRKRRAAPVRRSLRLSTKPC